MGIDGASWFCWPAAGPVRQRERWAIIASWGMGWDHVSVSMRNRTPTWREMDTVARVFFRNDETAMQLHVPRSAHVNLHTHCLHLWRPHVLPIPLPPLAMV